jgi:hypothetical protein
MRVAEMAVDAAEPETPGGGEAAEGRFRRAWEKAEPADAAIELDPDVQFPPERGQGIEAGLVMDGRDDAQIGNGGSVLGQARRVEQDRRGNPGLPQRRDLVRVAERERVRAGGERRPRGFDHADAIAVTLHDREEAAVRAGGAAVEADIVGEGVEVDFEPGRAQARHSAASLCADADRSADSLRARRPLMPFGIAASKARV